MNTSQPETIDIEQLLAQAGIDFAVVAHCPHPRCEICTGNEVPAAA